MSFIAGRYSITLNNLAIGQVKDGVRLSHQIFKQLIMGDSWGETKQDAVYRGADLTIAMELLEYNAAAVLLAIWPYAATLFDLGVIGTLDVGGSKAKSMVLTAIAGTSASATPATATFPNSILLEGFPIDLLLASELRTVPWRGRVYPSNSGIFGTQT